MKLATIRRASAVSSSVQPSDLASPSTATSATNLPTILPTVISASSAAPTVMETPTMTAASVAPSQSSPSRISNAPTVAFTAQASDTSLPVVSSTNSDDLVTRLGLSTLQKRFAHPGEKIPRLTKNPTRAQVMSITTTLLMLDCPFTFVDVVPIEVVPYLETLLQSRHYLDRVARKACYNGAPGHLTTSFMNFVHLTSCIASLTAKMKKEKSTFMTGDN
jgi:hypothetical protein